MKAERLKAMGVQPWYARLVLQGAGRSPSFEFEEGQLSAEEAGFPSEVTEVSEVGGIRSEAESLASLEPPLRPSADLSVESADVSEVSIESRTSSGMHLGAINSETAAQVDLPAEQSLMLFQLDLITVICGNCSSEQASSLSNLTSAICSAFYRRNIQLAESGSFVWPVFDALSLRSRNTNLHKTSISRFLQKLNVAGSSVVMLLGVDISTDAFMGLLDSEDASCVVVSSSVSPSDCLRDPAQKALLWKELLEARLGV